MGHHLVVSYWHRPFVTEYQFFTQHGPRTKSSKYSQFLFLGVFPCVRCVCRRRSTLGPSSCRRRCPSWWVTPRRAYQTASGRRSTGPSLQPWSWWLEGRWGWGRTAASPGARPPWAKPEHLLPSLQTTSLNTSWAIRTGGSAPTSSKMNLNSMRMALECDGMFCLYVVVPRLP